MTPHIPAWMEGSLTAFLILLIVVPVMLGAVGRFRRQSKTDGSIDERGGKFQDMLLKQLEHVQLEKDALRAAHAADMDRLNAEKADSAARNRELNDRLAAAYTLYVEAAMKHGSELLATANRASEENMRLAAKHDESIKRVHTLMDETNVKLARCEERDRVRAESEQETKHRLEVMERIVTGKVAQSTLTT